MSPSSNLSSQRVPIRTAKMLKRTRPSSPLLRTSGYPSSRSCSRGERRINVTDFLASFSPIQRAVEENSPAIVEALLARGANVHHRDYKGDTLLHRAATLGHPAVVQFLLRKGVKVDLAGDTGHDALNGRRFYCGVPDSVRFLLEAGADPNVCSKDGMNALGYVRRWQDQATGRAILDLLVKAGAEYPQPYLHVAVRENDLEGVRVALKRGEDPNAKNAKGVAPLEFATVVSPEVIAALIDAGVV